MLEVTSLTRAFDAHPVIVDVTSQLAAGEVVTIAGPSGCGKSTLPRCITGLVRPTAGRVVLDGNLVTRVPDRLRWSSGTAAWSAARQTGGEAA